MFISGKTKRDLFCEQKNMVIWWQQSTKSSTKDVNLGTITDTLSLCKFSPLSGIRVKPRLHRRRRRIFESFYARHSWQVLWRIIMESSNNYTSSTRAVRRAKEQPYYCSLYGMTSGGRILWKAVAVCELSKTSCQTGNLKMNEGLGNDSKDQLNLLTHWLDISQTPRETQQEFINLDKVLPWIFLWLA